MSVVTSCTHWILLAAFAAAGDGSPAPRNADAALAAAAKERRAANGKKGAERMEALTRAANAYERVSKEFGDAPAAKAEASFRAGEIWRALKREEDAKRCFETTTTCAGVPTFVARAWTELGHEARRAREFDEALRCYDAATRVVPEQRAECVRALTWRGKLLVDTKHEQEGHELLLSIGRRYPDFPVDDIRNVDLVAIDWIRGGRVQEARELVEQCVERHGVPTEGERDVSDAVRHAIDRMRSRELINEAGAGK